MDYLNMKAYGKINLTLDVIRKRDDGYHDLQMVMQTVKLYDRLFIKIVDKYDLKLVTDLKWLPTTEGNLVYFAIQQMKKDYNIKEGIFIKLKKNIPVAAGMAGGSSDCAAALVGVRNLLKLPISNEELTKYSKQFGADVPYCIMRGTYLAEGIGDILTKLEPHPDIHVLIAKPPISVSTPTVFKSLDLKSIHERPDTKGIITAISNSDINEITSRFCNVLENVTIPLYPIIAEIKNIMLSNGALNSLMSGSGPTVFGYYDNYTDMFNTKKILEATYPKMREIYVTSIFNPNVYQGNKSIREFRKN